MIRVKGMVDMNDTEETKTEITDSIGILLRLAYEELIEPKYDAYPTCDLIACFLDAEEAFGSEFLDIFNNAVLDYKDNLEKFKKEIINLNLDKILEALSLLKDSEESNFDFFSKEHRVICNMALASALLPIYTYASSNQGWLNNKKEKLEKSTVHLLETYISGKGWQHYFIKGKKKYVHTLSTWLSLLSLTYIPEGIITEDQRNEIAGIKKAVKDWLEQPLQREDECCSCFRPEELGDKDENTPNPVATAQAILALHHAGMDINDETIKCSIEFIKNQKTSIETSVRDEIPTKRIGQNYPGVQCCLQALLAYNIPHEDETVQYLLEKTIEFVNTISSREHKSDLDKYSYYPTLTSLLFYLFPPAKPVLIGSYEFQNIFKSFVSGANSIVLVGEIDIAYANLIPKNIDVVVLRRGHQDPGILEEHHWMEKSVKVDDKFESMNCVIVDGNRGLLSINPFCVTEKYNFPVHLKGKEVSSLINQLKIPPPPAQNSSIIKKEIVSTLSEFPENREIIERGLEEMETAGLQGVLEYFKLVPEQTEETLAPALGFEDRRAIESEFSRRGIFSRVFVNSSLKGLLEKSVDTDFTRFLVLDESSAYLLLNTKDTKEEEKVINCCSKCLTKLEKLFIAPDVHSKVKDFLEDKIKGGAKIDRISKIGEDDYETEFNVLKQPDNLLHFAKNEKIAIVCAAQGEDYGVITNSWEVATMCKVNNIKTFSIMKLLEEEGKNKNIYRIFRVPVDEFRQEDAT